MKKIALGLMSIGAMFLATQNLQAQVEEVEEIEEEIEAQAEVQEEFASLEVGELPQSVKDAIATDYSGATTKEAWVKTKDDKKVYKIKLDVNGQTEKVYIDQDGNWIKKDKVKDTK